MKPFRLYALLVVLAVVGLFAWSGADWYQKHEQAETIAQTALRQAAGQLGNLTLKGSVADPAALAVVLGRTVHDPRWKSIILSSPERGTEYYRGPRLAVPAEKAVPHWNARSTSEILVSLPVFASQGKPLLLEGIYEFYGRTEVFGLLRACGLTLVGLLLLTTVVVFLASRSKDEPETVVYPPQPAPESTPAPAPVSSAAHAETAERDEYWFEEDLADLPAMEHPVEAEAPVPPTGMGWQSYLNSKLDEELKRASGLQQDLALVLLAVKDGNPPADWGAAVRQAFPTPELTFEQADGTAVILPAHTLEQALRAARQFLEGHESLGVVHAGVAARSGRNVAAGTLFSEAEAAKRRSLSGTVRVLGLKTDDRSRANP